MAAVEGLVTLCITLSCCDKNSDQLFAVFFRYSCNRYDEKDAQAARDAQAVSTQL